MCAPREGEHLSCGDGTAGQLGHFGHGVSLLDSGISGLASVPALVGPLAGAIVDLDTVDPPDKIRIWYTLGTQDVRKRPTAANARLDQMA